MAAQHSITSRSTRLVAAVCLALLLEPARPALAQNTGELVDLPFLVHWAGGEGLDGGSYNVGGETLRFFRLPVSYDPGDEGRSWGLRLRFETAFGLYDFGDFIEDLDLDRVQAVTLLPGIGLPIRLREKTFLVPYVDIGTAYVSDGGGWTFLARTGVALELERRVQEFRLMAEPKVELLWSRGSGSSLDDELGSIGIKLGGRHPTPFAPRGRRIDLGAYGKAEYFFIEAELLDGQQSVDSQFEVGMSMGTVEASRIWRIPLPRLSVGYTFGDHLTGIRVGLGGRF